MALDGRNTVSKVWNVVTDGWDIGRDGRDTVSKLWNIVTGGRDTVSTGGGGHCHRLPANKKTELVSF